MNDSIDSYLSFHWLYVSYAIDFQELNMSIKYIISQPFLFNTLIFILSLSISHTEIDI